MWWAKSEPVDLYLSGGTLALREGSRVSVLPVEGDDWASGLAGWLTDRPGRRWRVWLGGRQCRLHVVEPIPGIRTIEEAELALSASLSSVNSAVTARLAVWAPRGEQPWVTATIPASLISAMTGMLKSSQGHLVSLRPWWTVARGAELLNAAMCDDEAIHYWRSDGKGRVIAAATVFAAPAAQVAPLQRLRVSGPLTAHRLDLQAAEVSVATARGFAIQPLEEAVDAANATAV